MADSLVFKAAALLAACLTSWSAEPFRPAYHFTPERNWMNDPNGAVFYKGEYHLFYQHNPFGNTWGHMSWGHAVSPDLVHWKHLPVALAEENGVMIFSGSAVVDHHNSSGFCTSESCLVAIYTGHSATLQTQNIAYSNDRGRTWTKYSANPVIDLGMKDFRDPKVFWREASRKWVMVVALPKEHKVRFYASANLKEWKPLSDFGPAGAIEGLWECPDLFPLRVAGSSETRWVLVVSVNPGGPAGGSATQYFVGSFDGVRFRNENATGALWADYGKDFYAPTSFSDVPDGRRILIGWFSNWQYARNEPTSPWRTMQSAPREVGLKRTKDGLRLTQKPVKELFGLREKVLTLRNVTLAEANRRLAGFHSQTYEVELELVGEGGLILCAGDGVGTRAGIADGRMFIDRNHSGQTGFHPDFAGRHEAPGRGSLRVLVDRSSVELFAGDGEWVISDRIFPAAESDGLQLFGAGSAKVRSLRVWKLKAVVGEVNLAVVN